MSFLIEFLADKLPSLFAAVAGVIALLGMLWKARQSGKDAVRLEAAEDALEAQRKREAIRQELEGASAEEIARRADEWRVD